MMAAYTLKGWSLKEMFRRGQPVLFMSVWSSGEATMGECEVMFLSLGRRKCLLCKEEERYSKPGVY